MNAEISETIRMNADISETIQAIIPPDERWDLGNYGSYERCDFGKTWELGYDPENYKS